MNSKSYWRRRAVEYEREWAERCQSEIERELAGYFRESLKEIEDDIAALYGKYMRDNAVSYAEARRLIRGSEFREWRMSLREYVAAAHTSSAILKELNTLAMRSRISRLEKLYSETLRELQKLGERSESAVHDFLTTAYRERYYHGVFDFAQVGKLEIPVSKVEPKSLEKVLAQRWASGNFSSRIWKNTEKLSKVLKQTITQGLHRGLSIQKMATAVSREMNSSYKNAERLVRTEMNFVQNYAAKESMEAAGLSEYEFIATLDHRTTQRCRSLDGTVHLLEEFDPGTNAPPMHPRCRSTISAVITEGTRVARNKGGRNIRVPADMNYADWKKVYIDKTLTLEGWQNRREVLLSDENLAKIRIKAAQDGKILTLGLSQNIAANRVAEIAEIIKRAPENIRVLWNLVHEDIKIIDSNFKGGARYFPVEKGIRLDISEDATAFDQKPYRKIFHESAHLIDQRIENYTSYRSVTFKDEIFARTLINEAAAHVKTLMIGREFEAVCEQISAKLESLPLDEQHEISDIWHGVSNGDIHGYYGHEGDYWTRDGGTNVAKEAFAHMFAASVNNPAAVKHICEYFPRSFKLFEEIITKYVRGKEQP